MKGFFLGCNHEMWSSTIVNLWDKGQGFHYISGTRPEIDSLLPDEEIVRHDIRDSERGILPGSMNINLPALDETILHQYRSTEITVLDMADRMDTGYAFSYQERMRLYLKMLAFWLYMVDRYQPDFVIFQQTPHSVDGFILFAICQQQNIPMLSFLPITPLQLVLPVRDYSRGLEDVIQMYSGYSEKSYEEALTDMPEYLCEYMGKLSESYADAIPPYLQQRLEQNQYRQEKVTKFLDSQFLIRKLKNLGQYGNYMSRIGKGLIKLLRLPHVYFMAPAPENSLKKPGEPLETSRLSGQEWRKYKRLAARYKIRLQNVYNRHCKEIGDVNYIYVALHYQPERTSTPEAGRFSNQLLMVKMLSEYLPAGWKIVVKENPTQLLPYTMHGERGRYPYFYQDLAAIENVILTRIDTPQFDLIDGAKAVATLTGTTGWEACVRGKPVLIFGEAWYRGCEGVFYCGAHELCLKAMSQIEKGSEIDPKKVFYFLYCLYKNGFRGYLRAKRFDDIEQGVQSNITNLTQIIESELNRI